MAITVTDRGSVQSTPGASGTISRTSASFTPAAGSLVIAAPSFSCVNSSGGASDMTFAGTDTFGDTGGGSWTQGASCTRGSRPNGSFCERVALWYRVIGTGAGAGTVTITGTIGAGTTSTDSWMTMHTWEIAGQHATPAGLAANPANNTTTSDFTCDLGGVPAATSAVFGVVHDGNINDANIVQPTGWTEADEIVDAGYAETHEWAYKLLGSVQAPVWTGMSTGLSQGCALEIKAAPAAESGHQDQARLRPPGLLSPRGLLTPIGDSSVVGAVATNAAAGSSSATATALDTGKTVAVSAGVAQATATANNPTVSASGATNATPSTATATATAYDTGKTVAISVTTATVTATANNAGKTVAISVSTATVTAAANNAGKTVAASAGVAQATATVNSATITSAAQQSFPTTVSANGRYFKDQFGNPWMMHGEAAWWVSTSVPLTDSQTYLNDRAGRGVNTIIYQPLRGAPSTTEVTNYYGNSPFTGTAFQSSLNEAYWQNVDECINYAAAKGITVILFVAYLGFNHPDSGFWRQLAAASNAQVQSYGALLGARYKDKANVIWCVGGDYTPTATEKDRYDHIMVGIQSAGDTHLATAHNNQNTDAASEYDSFSWFTVNAIYAYDPNPVSTAATGYNRSTHRPTFLIENRYSNYSGGYTLAEVRRGQWQVVLVGGIGGHIVGNEDIWTFGVNTGDGTDYDWDAHLSDVAITHSHQIKTLFDDLTATKWIELAPDLTDTFLTSGESSGTTQAAASFSTHIGLVYVATTGSITVDLTEISAHVNVTVKWFDPTNGSYSTVGTYATSAPQTFTHPGANAAGDNDRVLVVQGTSDTSASAGSASGTGTANNAGKTVAVNAGVAQATATAINPSVQVGSFATAQAQPSSAIATANDAGKTVSVAAGRAQATAAINGGIAAIGATPGTASVATATGNAIKASIAASAIVALAVAAGQDASPSNGSVVATYGPLHRTSRPNVFRTKRPGVG